MLDHDKNRDQGKRRYVLRLFVAGDAPNSRIARENLRRLQESVAECDFEVEIVDVMENPQSALDHGVFVTPALQIIEPGPEKLIFGNLTNKEALEILFPEEDR